uniref:Uncharacterized protein n=1 Tax=Poecilia latipinna TaxID=48699 RepID=A0A3B3USB9_9TELE
WLWSGKNAKIISATPSGPGSGKALQCERLEERFGLRHVTLGDLLCSEMQSHSERGRHLQDILERGEKLPEETLLELLCDAVASAVRQGKGLVVSGFPRDLRQAEEYEAKASAVVLLSCSPETMTSRVQSRSRSSSSSESALQRRAESFCSDAQAVIAHYERKMLLHTVRQGEGSIPYRSSVNPLNSKTSNLSSFWCKCLSTPELRRN